MDECRKQFDEIVASDHPDVMGGIVWSDCELRWINEKLHAAKAAEESLKTVERALDDVDYSGTYADGVRYLKQQLAAALAAIEAKDEALELHGKQYPHMVKGYCLDALAIKPDASALKAHDEALIERCAEVYEEYQGSAETCAAAIRELKSQL